MNGLKRYRPDTPEEWAVIGSIITDLGITISGATLFQDDKWITLSALGLTWLGKSVSKYFEVYFSNKGPIPPTGE